MRILYHHRTASRDGQAVHIEALVDALRRRGHEVRIVSPESTTPGSMGAEIGWIQKLKGRLPKAAYELLEISYSVVAYVKLARAVKQFKPDVIYERYNLFLLAGALVRRRFGVPVLLEVNSPLAQERAQFDGLAMRQLARWLEGMAWRNCDFVLPVTGVLAAHVAAADVPVERIVVIPNGIDEAHFALAPNREDAKRMLGLEGSLVLGFTGFVRDWHGVDRVIRWLSTDAAPRHAVLLIVGDGPVRVSLEKLAIELALDTRVRFTGVLPRESIPDHVAAFDIALQPMAVPYASPLKLFEYLALGKAIVAPAQPNIQEILTHRQNAVLFDPTNPGAFESALSELCRDAQLRNAVAAGAAATISRRSLTWAANAQRVEQLASAAAANESAGERPAMLRS